MSLFFYLEKGASLNPDAPCLTLDGVSRSYGQVVELAEAVARALRRSGVRPGDKVGILSANDPVAFTCVFGIARAGGVWCPINPRNAADENAELLDLFDCATLIFQPGFEDLVRRIAPKLPKLTTLVRLGDGDGFAPGFEDWLAAARADPAAEAAQPEDVVALVGTGGTTGRPKGVMLDRPQPRGDVGDHADELPLRRAAGVPGPGPADARGRRPVLPDPRPRRRSRDHGQARRRPVPGTDRTPPASRTRSCPRR